MGDESSYRSTRLPPRCRLITSSWCTSWEGFDCSSIKVVRELGSYTQICWQTFTRDLTPLVFSIGERSFAPLELINHENYSKSFFLVSFSFLLEWERKQKLNINRNIKEKKRNINLIYYSHSNQIWNYCASYKISTY